MNYEEFKQMIKERLEKVYPDKEISIREVVKNNGVILDGLMIMAEGEDAVPSIYLNDYFEIYKKEPDPDLIIRDIVEVYETCRCEEPLDVERFKDYAYMKDKIGWKLISYERNVDLLKEVPHTRYLDLAVVFFCLLSHERLGCSTILIYKSHMEIWGITQAELYAQARKNSRNMLGYEVKDIYETLDTLLYQNRDGDSEIVMNPGQTYRELPMYVLTTCLQMYGATGMLYEEVLEECYHLLGGDFYILPGSIHELILIPMKKIKNEYGIGQMVADINEAYVNEEEVLSDHIYRYDGEQKKVRLICSQNEMTS